MLRMYLFLKYVALSTESCFHSLISPKLFQEPSKPSWLEIRVEAVLQLRHEIGSIPSRKATLALQSMFVRNQTYWSPIRLGGQPSLVHLVELPPSRQALKRRSRIRRWGRTGFKDSTIRLSTQSSIPFPKSPPTTVVMMGQISVMKAMTLRALLLPRLASTVPLHGGRSKLPLLI